VKTYCIVPNPPTEAQFAAAIEGPDTVRTSLDGTLAVLKWTGPTPEVFEGETVYAHVNILPIMNSPEWSEPMIGNGEP